MSKEQTANKVADTAVVTENPTDNKDLRKQIEQVNQENAKLREQRQQAEKDKSAVFFFLEDITALRLIDLRAMLEVLPNVKGNAHSAVLNAMHVILDELETDIDLIQSDLIDELNERYEQQKDKILRGGGD